MLAALSRDLAEAHGTEEALAQLSRRAAEILPIDGAAVMVRGDRGLQSVAATDEALARVDQSQVELGEGPSLTAEQSGEPVLVADLRGDAGRRFARFAAAASLQGVRAAFAFPIMAQAQGIGALSLYHRQPGGLGEEDVAAAQLLTTIASSFLGRGPSPPGSGASAIQLQEVLQARIGIEQAQGKLAAALRIDPDAALRRLRAHARQHRLQPHEVAERLLEGALDPDDLK